MTYRAIGKKYGISATAALNVVQNNPDIERRLAEKYEQNTMDMFAYMDGQKGKVQRLMTSIVEALSDPEKLARANVRDLATAYGILADKYTAPRVKTDEDVLKKAKELLGEVNGVIS